MTAAVWGKVNHNGAEQRQVRSKPQGYSEVKASLIGEALSEELDNTISHPKRACVKQGSSPERQNRSEGGSRPGLAACMLGSPGEPESSRACLGICQGSKHLTERLGKFPQRAAAISTHGFKCKVSGSQSQVPGGRALARLCFAHPEEPMTSNTEHVLDADGKVAREGKGEHQRGLSRSLQLCFPQQEVCG